MTTPTSSPAGHDPDKQQAILDAAIKVFAQHGFRNTDVDVIAREAGVGKGTVYRYFGNKQQLFRATADWGMKQLERNVFAALEGIDDSVEMIRRGAVAYAEFFQKQPEFVEILIIERAEFRGAIPDTHLVYREKNRAFFEDSLRRGVERGELREVNVHETMNALANMLYGIVVCGCLEGASRKLSHMAAQGVDVFLHGLLAHPASTRKENGA